MGPLYRSGELGSFGLVTVVDLWQLGQVRVSCNIWTFSSGWGDRELVTVSHVGQVRTSGSLTTIRGGLLVAVWRRGLRLCLGARYTHESGGGTGWLGDQWDWTLVWKILKDA